MLPVCVTSVEKPSGPLTGLKLEKVEDPKEERGAGREAERADEVGVAGKGVEEAIPRPSEGPQKPQFGRKKGGAVKRWESQKPQTGRQSISKTPDERVSDAPKLSQPAAEKTSFRGEPESRHEPPASPEAGSFPGTQVAPGEKKCIPRGRKKKSKATLERSAVRMRSYVQRFAPMQSPDFVPGNCEALTFLLAAIRGFQKALRKIVEDASRVRRRPFESAENSDMTTDDSAEV
jgi:hypothetical protein